jgi:hypothetical protein
MRALTFWKTVVRDRADLLDQLITLLDERSVRYCVIGGQAVNAYVQPVVSLDLDLVVAIDQMADVESLLRERFTVERLPHSLKVSTPGSDLRAQIRTDPRYAAFVERATVLDVLGIPLPVASLDDLLQGTLWAVTDETRRPSKRQKDLADIARLLEVYPNLRERVPAAVLDRLIWRVGCGGISRHSCRASSVSRADAERIRGTLPAQRCNERTRDA